MEFTIPKTASAAAVSGATKYRPSHSGAGQERKIVLLLNYFCAVRVARTQNHVSEVVGGETNREGFE
jgi:hypothetical protein